MYSLYAIIKFIVATISGSPRAIVRRGALVQRPRETNGAHNQCFNNEKRGQGQFHENGAVLVFINLIKIKPKQ